MAESSAHYCQNICDSSMHQSLLKATATTALTLSHVYVCGCISSILAIWVFGGRKGEKQVLTLLLPARSFKKSIHEYSNKINYIKRWYDTQVIEGYCPRRGAGGEGHFVWLSSIVRACRPAWGRTGSTSSSTVKATVFFWSLTRCKTPAVCGWPLHNTTSSQNNC